MIWKYSIIIKNSYLCERPGPAVCYTSNRWTLSNSCLKESFSRHLRVDEPTKATPTIAKSTSITALISCQHVFLKNQPWWYYIIPAMWCVDKCDGPDRKWIYRSIWYLSLYLYCYISYGASVYGWRWMTFVWDVPIIYPRGLSAIHGSSVAYTTTKPISPPFFFFLFTYNFFVRWLNCVNDVKTKRKR